MSRRSVPLVDRFTDAVFALDTGFRLTYVNDRAEALFERPRSDLLGRVIWDAVPETIETQVPEGFYRAMDEQVAVSFEVYHTLRETWYEARAYPGSNGLSVFVRDVTDRRERERALAHHAAVVEAIHDAVFVLDRTNRIVAVNDAAERHLGIDGDDAVGDHVERLTRTASIDDDPSLEIGRAIDDVRVGRTEHRRIEVPYVDADGDERMGELRLVPVDDEVATVAGVLRDVTDRHVHERVVESLHQLTRWLVRSDDPEEICTIAVHAGSELLELPISGVWLLDETRGYLDPVAGTAQAYDELGGFPRFSSGEGLVWDVFESGEVEVYEDLREIGGVYNPETPIRSEIIAPIGTHGVLITGAFEPHRFDETDVELVELLVENTGAALDRAEGDRLLRERTDQLERQTERLQAVAEVLSSDLKRKLEAVADAIEESDDGDVKLPFAEEAVETTIDRAERLVDDVREFARNATTPGARRRIDLEAAIDAAVEYSRLESASIAVETPATLRADPDRFGRLLEAIFDDVAARAGDEVTVRVDVVDVDEPDERGIYVLDDATEPPSDAIDRPFDPTRANGRSASGLGLALVRAIAEAHGWSASLEHPETGGAKLEIRGITTLELRTPTDAFGRGPAG